MLNMDKAGAFVQRSRLLYLLLDAPGNFTWSLSTVRYDTCHQVHCFRLHSSAAEIMLHPLA